MHKLTGEIKTLTSSLKWLYVVYNTSSNLNYTFLISHPNHTTYNPLIKGKHALFICIITLPLSKFDCKCSPAGGKAAFVSHSEGRRWAGRSPKQKPLQEAFLLQWNLPAMGGGTPAKTGAPDERHHPEQGRTTVKTDTPFSTVASLFIVVCSVAFY